MGCHGLRHSGNFERDLPPLLDGSRRRESASANLKTPPSRSRLAPNEMPFGHTHNAIRNLARWAIEAFYSDVLVVNPDNVPREPVPLIVCSKCVLSLPDRLSPDHFVFSYLTNLFFGGILKSLEYDCAWPREESVQDAKADHCVSSPPRPQVDVSSFLVDRYGSYDLIFLTSRSTARRALLVLPAQ
jgi:hypothetical protein